MIACIAVPYFAAQVERRDNRSLTKTPLAIGGQPWEPAPIFAFSQEVAKRGVRPGIPLRLAHILAPQAHFMPAHQPHYQQTSGEMCEMLVDFSPLVESLDLWQSNSQRFDTVSGRTLPAHYLIELGDIPAKEIIPFTQQIGKTVREKASLSAAVGVAQYKFTAQVAATVARLNHIRPVSPGTDRQFLTSYPLRFLPLDKETSRRCRLLGIHTLGDLASLPPTALKTQFGQEITHLQQWAQGHDDSPVRSYKAERTEKVAYQFDDPLTSLEQLNHLFSQIAQELASKLQTAALQARKLSLILETETNARPHQQTFRQPTAVAHHLDDTLKQLLNEQTFESGIVAVTVTLTGLVPATTQQLSLFAPRADLKKAYTAVRNVAAKYQLSRFYQAALADPHPLAERRFRLHTISYDAAVA